MKTILTLGLAAVVVLLCPQDARAQATTTNQLYLCAPGGMPTLCYSASTTVPGGKEFVVGGYDGTVCDLVFTVSAPDPDYWSPFPSVTVNGLVIFGGGHYETLGHKFHERYRTLGCHAPITVSYSGKVEPCAPGGVQKWQHQAKHFVNFKASSKYPDMNRTTFSYYLLPVSTCICEPGTLP